MVKPSFLESKHSRCNNLLRWYFKRNLRPSPIYPTDGAIWNLCYFTHNTDKTEKEKSYTREPVEWNNTHRNDVLKVEYTMIRIGRCLASKGSELNNIQNFFSGPPYETYENQKIRDNRYLRMLVDFDLLKHMLMFLRHFPYNEEDRTLAHTHNTILMTLTNEKFWTMVDAKEKLSRLSELLLIGFTLFREDRSEERAVVWKSFMNSMIREYLKAITEKNAPPPPVLVNPTPTQVKKKKLENLPKPINSDEPREEIDLKNMIKLCREQSFQSKFELFPSDCTVNNDPQSYTREKFVVDVAKDDDHDDVFINDLLCAMNCYISCLVKTDFTDNPRQIDFCHHRIDALLTVITLLMKTPGIGKQLYAKDFGSVFARVMEAVYTQRRPAVHSRNVLFQLIEAICSKYSTLDADWKWYTLYSKTDLRKLLKFSRTLTPSSVNWTTVIIKALEMKKDRTDMSALLLLHIPPQHMLLHNFASKEISVEDHFSFVTSMMELHKKCPFFWSGVAQRVHYTASKHHLDMMLLKENGYDKMMFD